MVMEQPINIVTDGEYEIAIRAIDEAGNRSASQTINVYKDETKPKIGNISLVGEAGTSSFKVSVGAKDEESGIAKFICMIGENQKGQTENADGVVQVTGLTYKTTYTNVYIRVYNNAGLYIDTLPTTVTTKARICNTSYCSGGSSTTCSSCSGTGTVTKYHRYEYVSATKFDIHLDLTCGGCKKGFRGSPTTYKAKYRCIYCGVTNTPQAGKNASFCSVNCAKSIYPRDSTTTCTNNTCTSCNGTGKKTYTCSHGYTSSHRYCSHYNNTSLYSHEY